MISITNDFYVISDLILNVYKNRCLKIVVPAEKSLERTASRLSKPLIGDDGRIYACSERNLFAFESNGSIAWTVPLNYTCDYAIAPVHGGREKVRDFETVVVACCYVTF